MSYLEFTVLIYLIISYIVLLPQAQLTVGMGEMQLRDAKKLLAQA